MQVRRERRLESNLAKLRKLCIEVGADDAEVAASVHHTLRNYHESMRGHYYTCTKPSALAGIGSAPPAQVCPSNPPCVLLHCTIQTLGPHPDEIERSWRGPYAITSTGSRLQVVALTDTVFTTLDARMEEMNAVKEEREATLGELKEVLMSMWSSVGITEEDENRKFFERMLSSPSRLHTHTHEKVRGLHRWFVPSHACAPVPTAC